MSYCIILHFPAAAIGIEPTCLQYRSSALCMSFDGQYSLQTAKLTSVARLWLAPLASRNLTTLSWFSWAAIYNGVKPFCDWTFTAAPFATSSFTTSSCPAATKSITQLNDLLYRNPFPGKDFKQLAVLRRHFSYIVVFWFMTARSCNWLRAFKSNMLPLAFVLNRL